MGCSSSDIFLIKAETYANRGDFGTPCFNLNGGTFLNRNWISSRTKLCMGDDIGGIFDETQSSCSSEQKETYDIEVTKYGGLVNKLIFYSMKSQFYISNARMGEGCTPEGGVYNMSYEDIIKNGIVVKNTSTCQSQEGWPPGCIETNSNCAYSINTNCFTFGDTPTDCKRYSFEYNHPNCDDAYDGSENIKSFGSLGTPVNYDNLVPKVAEANDKKIDIFHKNSPQNDQGDNCGNERTSCYQLLGENYHDALYSPTGFGGWDIIGQKWRVKVASPENELKSDLSQKYQLYAYYYTGQNPDTTVSPCCNSCGCFDGTIVAQKDIKLSYDQSNKKSEYILSRDYIEFDNFEYTGPAKNLYYCSKGI